MDDSNRVHTAMIVEDGVIRSLGDEKILKTLEGERYEAIDLEGRVVFPGLIEGHGHFTMLGEVLCGLDLNGLTSWQEVLDRTVDYAHQAEGDAWILGKGWHPNHWDTLPPHLIEGYPDNRVLSELFPDRPVVLQHSSFHALMANEKALEIGDINDQTPDPTGGRIVRDQSGRATGILEENAMDLVMAHYHNWLNNRSESEKEAETFRYIDSATQRSLSYGITTFVDAGISPLELEVYERYREKYGLDIRIWAMAGGQALLKGGFEGKVPYESTDQRLYVKATKAFVDGALGSNGAWMIGEYADQPGWFGQNVTELSTLRSIGQKCLELDMQLGVHAIGDRANRTVLDLYEALFRESNRDGQDLRWRVEHAQIIDPEDISRFSALGVIPSMQSIHCTSDAPMVIPKIGPDLARQGAYPWRSLIDQGALIANGTDCPVESVNPFENLYAAVSRQGAPGENPFFPEQSMSRIEAIRSLTSWNAYACRLEAQTGSLEPGKWADFFLIDTDLIHCSDEELLNAKVFRTYLEGVPVWSRSSQDVD